MAIILAMIVIFGVMLIVGNILFELVMAKAEGRKVDLIRAFKD